MTMWLAIPLSGLDPEWRMSAMSPGRMSVAADGPTTHLRSAEREAWYSRTDHHRPSAHTDSGARDALTFAVYWKKSLTLSVCANAIRRSLSSAAPRNMLAAANIPHQSSTTSLSTILKVP